MRENKVTAHQIARAAGIGPRTKKFALCDEYGHVIHGKRSAHVLAAVSRSDKTPELSADVHRIAYAIHKCFSTGRMDLMLAKRVREDYSPYRVCALVAQVVNADPDANIGQIADYWINAHAEEL